MLRQLVSLALLVICVATAGAVHPEPLRPVALRDICTTNGEIRMGPDGRLEINTPSSRAVLRFRSEPVAEIRFTYLGPSEQSKPLASGELRRQIGLKLRAQDTCNLVYAMWHIEPDARVSVWHGDIGPVVAGLDGPVGLRTDNARFAFDYRVGRASQGLAMPDCRQTPGD
jgi:hypothetical protein